MALTLPTFNVGKILAASLQQLSDALAGTKIAHKTDDEPRISDTTFSDDDHLVLTYAAGLTYILDGWLPMEGAAAGDFKMQYTYTASSVTRLDYSLLGLGNTPTAAEGDFKAVAQLGSTTSPSGTTTLGTITANWVPGLIHGTLVTATAGTLTLQWAQNASNATPTILKKGSWMRLTPILG